MSYLKKYSVLVLLLSMFVPAVCVSQTNPPPVAMPTQQNKIIVDKIIEAANYKTYFTDYCLAKINATAEKEKWNDQKTNEITGSINFRNFRDAVYNMFAFYNEVELEELLSKYKKDSSYQTQNVITANKIVTSNLEIFAKSLVEGRYVK